MLHLLFSLESSISECQSNRIRIEPPETTSQSNSTSTEIIFVKKAKTFGISNTANGVYQSNINIVKQNSE